MKLSNYACLWPPGPHWKLNIDLILGLLEHRATTVTIAWTVLEMQLSTMKKLGAILHSYNSALSGPGYEPAMMLNTRCVMLRKDGTPIINDPWVA